MSLYDLSYIDTTGATISMADYAGKVLLIVNTATGCGLTPQFTALEKLYQTYKDQWLVVIGFPCNQFAGQEPVSDTEMVETCQLRYGVTFALSAKIHVNGKDTHPIFKHLKDSIPNGILGKTIKRNFTKFLIGRDGTPLHRYAPTTSPEEIEKDIIQEIR